MRLVLTIILAFVVVGPASAANILVNPGFESGVISPWYTDQDFGATEAWNATNTDAQSGSFSATNVGNSSMRQDFTAIAAASIAEVSLWVMQPEPAIFAARYFYSDNSYETGDLQTIVGTDWEFFDLTDELNTSKELTGLSIYGYIGASQAESRTFIDNVVIDVSSTTPVPEPSSMLLLSLGAAALALIRKRRAAAC